MAPQLRTKDYSFVAQAAQQLGQAVGAGIDYGINQMKTERYSGALQDLSEYAIDAGEQPNLDQLRLYDKALKANAKSASQTTETYKATMAVYAEDLAEINPKFSDRKRGKMLFRQYVSPPTADDLKSEETRAAYTRRMTEQIGNWQKKLQEIKTKEQGAKVAEFGRQAMQGAPMTQGPEQQVTPIGETGGFTEQNIVNPQPAATREAAYTGIQERAQAAGMETPTKTMMDQYAPGVAALPTGAEQEAAQRQERRLDLTEQSITDTREYRNATLGLRQIEALRKAKKSAHGDRTLNADRILTYAERAQDDAQKVRDAAEKAIERMTADEGQMVDGEFGLGLPPTDKRVLRKKAELAAAEKTLRDLAKGIQQLYTDKLLAERTILGAQAEGNRAGEKMTENQVHTLADWMQQSGPTAPTTQSAEGAAQGGGTSGQTQVGRQGAAAEKELRQQAITRLRDLNNARTNAGKNPLPFTEKNVRYLMNVIRRNQGAGG